jgi:hypothetical protein
MNLNSESLITAVQNVIFSFEEGQSSAKKASIQDIADKTNSSYTTIRELKKGILKNLSVKKALEISTRLSGPLTLVDLLKQTDSSDVFETQEYSRRFSHLFDYSVIPNNFEEIISNKEFSKIVWAAFSTKHISKEEISNRWGQEGLEKLEFLLSKEILINDNGIIKGVATQAASGILSTYKQLGIGYSLYNIENSKKEENWVSFQTNNVNKEFISEFREDLRSLFSKFNKKSNEPKFTGDKQMFFGMIFDKYLNDTETKQGKL